MGFSANQGNPCFETHLTEATLLGEPSIFTLPLYFPVTCFAKNRKLALRASATLFEVPLSRNMDSIPDLLQISTFGFMQKRKP